MQDTVQTTDIAVIGAGPVGLFAIFEAGMLGMKCHVIDTLSAVGGQCVALYPEKPIYDIPAYPAISGGELIDKLMEQAKPFDPVFHLDQQVTQVTPLEDGRFDIQTSKGTKINAGAVVIAAGAGAFGPNRPPLEGIENFEGTGVQYYVTNREQYRGKKLVIAGGGDSAVDWAISLAELAEKVTVVHRRPKFRAAPESVARMHALAETDKVDLAIPYQLSGLKADGETLTGVVIKTLEGDEKTIDADHLLPFFGLAMNLGPIADWGLNLDKSHIEVDQASSQTSTKGIYAVGDIATYKSKLKLILTGFAEAAHAVHAARAHMFPEQVFHFEYSTTQGVPAESLKEASN
ncbi:MAG: NAD(P)/FAD-dependent oxidoreductase [Alphaproteobacteria bacterium]